MTIPNTLPSIISDYSVRKNIENDENNVIIPSQKNEFSLRINIDPRKREHLNKKNVHLFVIKTKRTKSIQADEIIDLKQKVATLEHSICLKDEEIDMLKGNLNHVKSNMDHFSYIASHDLKEPLRMVTSYLGLLKNKFGSQLDAKAKTYIDFAIDGGAKLHTMFNGLLDLSQIGRVDEQKKEINFHLLLNETLINLSKKIKESKAEIKILTPLPVVIGYEKSLNRLLENLICNAIKFCKSDEIPFIKISAVERKSFWEFYIADNGIGIEACYYQQIFAVFSKLHAPATYPGNGIGLAICKKAVEHHEGVIWVSSDINKGSNFYFTLPKIRKPSNL